VGAEVSPLQLVFFYDILRVVEVVVHRAGLRVHKRVSQNQLFVFKVVSRSVGNFGPPLGLWA